ncbi:MAG: beta-galactosidase, partial [Bacteroides sp.]|nr:beta-galactosidase [Bacteroides sp.]
MKHYLSTLFVLLASWGYAQQTETLMLSGHGLGDTKTWEFYCSDGLNSKKWSKIEVPSQWELQGFGGYTYGRWYIVKGNEPSKETGTYRYSFQVSSDWKNKQVKIVFEGVMTDTEVKINGELAGDIHQGGFYRFEYDITDKLNYGKKNNLEVVVWKHSANRSVNGAERMADWWTFGGIYRPVYLEAKPQANIERVAVDAAAGGELSAQVVFNRIEAGYSLSTAISSLDGKEFYSAQVVPLNDADSQWVTTHWKGVKTWNPEDPNLYVMTLDLLNEKGEKIHTIQERIGFRTIEFRPRDGIYMNGTKLVMKGINRHSFHPDGGRTTNREISLQDALLIKEMNMNAVRFHYPPDKHFIEMCDSLGILVVNELAGWQTGYDTGVGTKLLHEMMVRDVNHPSIVLWSNGNEGGFNYDLDPLFREYDPQKRHVIHAWADFDDLDTHHYPTFLTGVARFVNGYKVFMPTEFMHGMYDQGHGAGLEDFWDNYTAHPLFAGGFMWDFSDNAVRRTDKGGILDTEAFNAPDGIVGPYREKEGSYYTVREVWAPIQFRKLFITPSFNGEFFVSNTYLFTNLRDCRMVYRLLSTPSPLRGGEAGIVASGEVKLPAIDPGETGKARMDLPAGFFDSDVLEVEAFDKFGKSICTWSWPVKYADEYFAEQVKGTESSGRAVAMDLDKEVVLRTPALSVTFNKENGMIGTIKKGETIIPFTDGPVPVGMKVKFQEYRIEELEGDAFFIAKYLGGIDSIVWKLTGNGLLYMDAVMLNRATGGGGFDDAFTDANILNFGITFSYPEEDVAGMRWMGRGPYRVWKNRIKGTNYNIWEKEYNNT